MKIEVVNMQTILKSKTKKGNNVWVRLSKNDGLLGEMIEDTFYVSRVGGLETNRGSVEESLEVCEILVQLFKKVKTLK